jgi:hypothetical protein
MLYIGRSIRFNVSCAFVEIMSNSLIDTVARELERPRELSSRVLNYIGGTYGVDEDAIGAFLTTELKNLEDYEIDLILSPVFTPKITDEAIFAELLGSGNVPREQWAGLVRELVERPTHAQLVTPDGQLHSVPLREVTIERYVHRLRLEASIPESVFVLLNRIPSIEDRPMLRAIARRPVWEDRGTREILERYLDVVTDRGSYTLPDMMELLHLAENRKPASVQDLLASIPRWAEALREQIDAAGGPKQFFHQGVEAMHGGDRDQRRQDDIRLTAKEKELAFLHHLQNLLT